MRPMRYYTDVEVDVEVDVEFDDMVDFLVEHGFSVVDESMSEVYTRSSNGPISLTEYLTAKPKTDNTELINEAYTELYATKDPAARLAFRWIIEKLEG